MKSICTSSFLEKLRLCTTLLIATFFIGFSIKSQSKPSYNSHPKETVFKVKSYNKSISPAAMAFFSSSGAWWSVVPSSGTPTARHEASYVQAGNKFYLIGGRKIKPVQVYDPINKTWTNKANTPVELHHFQAIAMDGLIYVVGAFTGSYPHEKPVNNIYIYNPVTNKWITGATIPQARRRGSAGVVVYNKKIYLAGGIKDGHWSGHVNWLDEYNPATNTWRILPNAPRARDHFQAAVVNGKLYPAAGRRTSASTNQTFNLTVPQVDVYDFAVNKWATLPSSSNIPTQRAGTASAVIGNDLIIIGGESGSQSTAHKHTEALNVTTNTWRRLADLKQGRHGTQAIVNNNGIYVAAGCANRGGTPELNSQEAFYFDNRTTPVGTAITPSKLSAPTSLNYGSVAVNSTSSKTVTLTNTGGNQAILISSVSKTGSSAYYFSSPYALPIAIAPGKSVNVSFKFNPKTTGSQSASFVINHTGQIGTTTIKLSGNGVNSGVKSFETAPQIITGENQLLIAYPNPVSDGQFSVHFPVKIVGEVPYVLVNQSGIILISDKLKIITPTSTLPFNFSGRNINGGLYYLQINSNARRYVVKVLVN